MPVVMNAPSTLAEPAVFFSYQSKPPPDGPVIYCNRLPTPSSLPVTLMHPVFGQFLADCEDRTPTDETEISMVLELAMALSSNEDQEA